MRLRAGQASRQCPDLIGAFFYFYRRHRSVSVLAPLRAMPLCNNRLERANNNINDSGASHIASARLDHRASIPKEVAMAEAAARKKVTIPMLMEKKKKGRAHRPARRVRLRDRDHRGPRRHRHPLRLRHRRHGAVRPREHDLGVVRGSDVHGAGGEARLAVRPADGRHALHELPSVGAAGGRQRRPNTCRRAAPKS